MYSAKSYPLTQKEYNYLLPAVRNKLLVSNNKYFLITSNTEDLTDLLNRLKCLYDNYDELKNMVVYKCSISQNLDVFRDSMLNLKPSPIKQSINQ